MAETIYTYWKASVYIDSLTEDIVASGIGDNYTAATWESPDTLYINYSEALSSGDKDILDDVVANHDSSPVYEEEGQIAVSDGEGSITYVSSEEYYQATLSGTVSDMVTVEVDEAISDITISGSAFNLDGGRADSVYGGTTAIDSGNAFTTY